MSTVLDTYVPHKHHQAPINRQHNYQAMHDKAKYSHARELCMTAFLKSQPQEYVYSPLIQEHRITGRLAPLLSDDDLKEMGITDVGGNRLWLKHYLLKVLARQA